MRRILRYLRARRFERDLDAEMQAHVDEKTDELMGAGMRPEEARAQALRTFGNRTRLAEACRDKWAFVPLDETAQPNVERGHRRSRENHADSDRYEQLASRRHLNSTQKHA